MLAEDSSYRTEALSPTPPLSEEHRRMLEEESSISPQVRATRPYYTAARRADVPKVFKGKQRRRGLVMITLSPSG